MELCRHLEIVNMPAGSILFQPGDKDDTMYVVKSGRIVVYIRVRRGETLFKDEVAFRKQNV